MIKLMLIDTDGHLVLPPLAASGHKPKADDADDEHLVHVSSLTSM